MSVHVYGMPVEQETHLFRFKSAREDVSETISARSHLLKKQKKLLKFETLQKAFPVSDCFVADRKKFEHFLIGKAIFKIVAQSTGKKK